MSEAMVQSAPFPTALAELVDDLTYKPGWTFTLRHMVREHENPAVDTSPALSEGLTLDVVSLTHDSHHPERGLVYRVHHYVIVPPATFNRASWQRWLLEQLLLIERHEAAEFFRIGGEQPYAPTHGPGDDPYVIRELTTDEARRTSFRGVTKEGSA